jgi:hypothetical protein
MFLGKFARHGALFVTTRQEYSTPTNTYPPPVARFLQGTGLAIARAVP